MLITSDFTIKIADYGTSKEAKEDLSQTYQTCTPYFSPLEIFTKEEYDPKMLDIWSLGITLWYILKREYFFNASSSEELKGKLIAYQGLT